MAGDGGTLLIGTHCLYKLSLLPGKLKTNMKVRGGPVYRRDPVTVAMVRLLSLCLDASRVFLQK